MEAGAIRGMNESFKSLQQVRSVDEQLKNRSIEARNSPLAASLSAVAKKVAELEGSVESGFYGVPASGKPPENFSTLNQHFGSLLALVDSADSAPTSQAQSVYHEELEALQNLESQWGVIRNQDIARLNSELVKAGKTAINPDKPASAPPSGDSEGDDEP
jgi:hypothetical protein